MPFKNKTVNKDYQKKYRETPEAKAAKAKSNREVQQFYRRSCLMHYSDGLMCCACCGETHYEFLSLDHIDGGGTEHRRQVGSQNLYSWLIQHDFPDGIQVLCHNCNQAKGFYGKCPHEKQKEIIRRGV